jgi:hypothetical protein
MPCLAPENTYYDKTKAQPSWYEAEELRPRPKPYYSSPSFSRREQFKPQIPIDDDLDTRNFDTLLEYLATRSVILRSKGITQLNDDWDDEGANAYTVGTWERAVRFTEAQARAATDSGFLIGVPMILPADQSSIDIHWRSGERDLLVNVPADLNKPATYYGTNRRGESTSGLLNTNNPRLDLLLWLSANK